MPISAADQPWEEAYRSESTRELAAILGLMGIRRLRVVTPADNVDLTIDGTISATARCLIISGGTQINLVAADDNPAAAAGLGGPCPVPLSGSTILLPIHTRQVWATNTTGAPTIVAGF